jgi:dynein heavy chain
MKQEVSRMKKGWALDDVKYHSEAQRDVIPGDDGRLDGQKFQVPAEGVLIHGIYLEGAAWSKGEKRLEDAIPKELYYQFPLMWVTAVYQPRNDKDKEKNLGPQSGKKIDLAAIEKSHYDCPVYKYPRRS